MHIMLWDTPRTCWVGSHITNHTNDMLNTSLQQKTHWAYHKRADAKLRSCKMRPHRISYPNPRLDSNIHAWVTTLITCVSYTYTCNCHRHIIKQRIRTGNCLQYCEYNSNCVVFWKYQSTMNLDGEWQTSPWTLRCVMLYVPDLEQECSGISWHSIGGVLRLTSHTWLSAQWLGVTSLYI